MEIGSVINQHVIVHLYQKPRKKVVQHAMLLLIELISDKLAIQLKMKMSSMVLCGLIECALNIEKLVNHVLETLVFLSFDCSRACLTGFTC